MRPADNHFAPKRETLTNTHWTSSSTDILLANPRQRPGLLVSVRNWQEASIALEAGIDVLDLKEPSLGPLGPVSDHALHDVVDGIQGSGDKYPGIPLSVALGELRDWTVTKQSLPARVGFAKLGLAGMRSQSDWQTRWEKAMAGAGSHLTPVAVAYADCRLADSPDSMAILTFAIGNGCKAFLLDTWDKQSGSLTTHLSESEISSLVDRARSSRMIVALAGSLSPTDIPAAVRCRPDLIAIRSAACSGGRTGSICSEQIRRFRQQLTTWQHVEKGL